MKIVVMILVLFLSCARPAFGQEEAPPPEGPWGIDRKDLVTYGIIGHTVLATYLEYTWWWEGNYHPFRFGYEGFFNNYSLGVDKVGHFYTSYFYFHTLRETLEWGGYSRPTAVWVGAGISSFFALSIEIGDGFSTYQFSPDDLAANLLGVGYGVLQAHVPFFERFTFKWSYWPSGIIPFDGKFRITDDYDGHLYWLSMDVHNLLPPEARAYWPKFLNLAVGYGGKNISGRPPWVGTPITSPGPTARKFAVALDYNLTSLPSASDTWAALKRIVDLFHYPAPGVRWVEGEGAQARLFLVH